MKNEDFGANAIDFSQDDFHVFRRSETFIHWGLGHTSFIKINYF